MKSSPKREKLLRSEGEEEEEEEEEGGGLSPRQKVVGFNKPLSPRKNMEKKEVVECGVLGLRTTSVRVTGMTRYSVEYGGKRTGYLHDKEIVGHLRETFGEYGEILEVSVHCPTTGTFSAVVRFAKKGDVFRLFREHPRRQIFLKKRQNDYKKELMEESVRSKKITGDEYSKFDIQEILASDRRKVEKKGGIQPIDDIFGKRKSSGLFFRLDLFEENLKYRKFPWYQYCAKILFVFENSLVADRFSDLSICNFMVHDCSFFDYRRFTDFSLSQAMDEDFVLKDDKNLPFWVRDERQGYIVKTINRYSLNVQFCTDIENKFGLGKVEKFEVRHPKIITGITPFVLDFVNSQNCVKVVSSGKRNDLSRKFFPKSGKTFFKVVDDKDVKIICGSQLKNLEFFKRKTGCTVKLRDVCLNSNKEIVFYRSREMNISPIHEILEIFDAKTTNNKKKEFHNFQILEIQYNNLCDLFYLQRLVKGKIFFSGQSRQVKQKLKILRPMGLEIIDRCVSERLKNFYFDVDSPRAMIRFDDFYQQKRRCSVIYTTKYPSGLFCPTLDRDRKGMYYPKKTPERTIFPLKKDWKGHTDRKTRSCLSFSHGNKNEFLTTLYGCTNQCHQNLFLYRQKKKLDCDIRIDFNILCGYLEFQGQMFSRFNKARAVHLANLLEPSNFSREGGSNWFFRTSYRFTTFPFWNGIGFDVTKLEFLLTDKWNFTKRKQNNILVDIFCPLTLETITVDFSIEDISSTSNVKKYSVTEATFRRVSFMENYLCFGYVPSQLKMDFSFKCFKTLQQLPKDLQTILKEIHNKEICEDDFIQFVSKNRGNYEFCINYDYLGSNRVLYENKNGIGFSVLKFRKREEHLRCLNDVKKNFVFSNGDIDQSNQNIAIFISSKGLENALKDSELSQKRFRAEIVKVMNFLEEIFQQLRNK